MLPGECESDALVVEVILGSARLVLEAEVAERATGTKHAQHIARKRGTPRAADVHHSIVSLAFLR
jgi:hypothetical protein